jgi:hypothetical protein
LVLHAGGAAGELHLVRGRRRGQLDLGRPRCATAGRRASQLAGPAPPRHPSPGLLPPTRPRRKTRRSGSFHLPAFPPPASRRRPSPNSSPCSPPRPKLLLTGRPVRGGGRVNQGVVISLALVSPPQRVEGEQYGTCVYKYGLTAGPSLGRRRKWQRSGKRRIVVVNFKIRE